MKTHVISHTQAVNAYTE